MEALGLQMTLKVRASQTLYGTFSSMAVALPDPSAALFLMGKNHVSRVRNACYCLLMVSFRVDLDIEGGTSTGYAAFVNRIRSHATGASKQ